MGSHSASLQQRLSSEFFMDFASLQWPDAFIFGSTHTDSTGVLGDGRLFWSVPPRDRVVTYNVMRTNSTAVLGDVRLFWSGAPRDRVVTTNTMRNNREQATSNTDSTGVLGDGRLFRSVPPRDRMVT